MASDISSGTTERGRLGLRARLALSHLAVIAVAMGSAGLGTLALVRAYLLASLQDHLGAQAELTAAALLADPAVRIQPPEVDPAYNTLQQQSIANLAVRVQNQTMLPDGDPPELLRPEAVQLTADLPTQVLVLDAQGSPVFQSVPTGPPGLQHSSAARAAQAGDTGRSVLRGEGEDWLVLALPLVREGDRVGALVLAHPLGDLNTVLADTRNRLLVGAGLGAGLAGLLGLGLAGRLVRPIAQLTAAAIRLGQGDFGYPLPTEGSAEVASLGRAFGRMRWALLQAERARAQFISDASHELRTPLTGIKGLVETLQDGAAADTEVRDGFIASIGEQTDRLIRLSQDLLTLARADEHALPLRLEPLDLGALVEGVVQRLRPEAERRGLRLEHRPAASALPVRADPDRLEQVLLNLLDNAFKHAPHGSPVTVQVVAGDLEPSAPGRSGEGAPSAAIRLGGGWAIAHVCDHGPGIPPEARARVFDRFYRADPARDRARGGSGLGLSIARALVEAHGGQIWMESPRPDWAGHGPPGARASLALPIAQGNQQLTK